MQQNQGELYLYVSEYKVKNLKLLIRLQLIGADVFASWSHYTV